MQRTILGLLALALLLGGGAVCLLWPESSLYTVGLGCLRLGVLFGVIWLAIPNVSSLFTRFPPWLVAATAAGIVVILWKRETIVFVGPVLVALWVLGVQWLGKGRTGERGKGKRERPRQEMRGRD